MLTRIDRGTCVLFLVLAGCRPGNEARPYEAEADAIVQRHLEEVVVLAREHSVRRDSVDWDLLRIRAVLAAAGSDDGTQAGIRAILQGLGDGHSFYMPLGAAQNERITVIDACDGTSFLHAEVPASIGYVRVPASHQRPEQEANAIRLQIRHAAERGVTAWIVDLRGNTGGNMWPMLSGLRPILGSPPFGYFVTADGLAEAWDVPTNAVIDDAGPSPRAPQRIAVLTDRATASAGEAVATAFRGMFNARSFGEATCGRATANRPFRLSNGAVLYLTVALLADRTGEVTQHRITPDELVETDGVMRRAVEWLSRVEEQ
jgi:carboxyl-terminal processing protease